MCKKYDVICIGFIVQDIVMSNIPYDALTRDTSVADEGLITSGGDAANQAVTLSYLGSHTALRPAYCRQHDLQWPGKRPARLGSHHPGRASHHDAVYRRYYAGRRACLPCEAG